MTIDLTPGSAEWARRVSPSKAAAILGQSPWDSQRAIYHMMRGEAPWPAETDAMERGNLCESAVLTWWRKHHDHTQWREQVTLTIGDWLVATPDAICVSDGEHVLVQAKTTGSQMDDWGDPGTDAVPTHVLIQVYLEMEVARRCGIPVVRAHVPVLGGYRNLFTDYVVQYDPDHGAALMDHMEAWRDLLAAGDPPPLDDTVSTYEAVRRVHPDIDAKAAVEVTRAQAVELLQAVTCLTASEARARLAKATVLDAMGRANYATCGGVKVARRQPRGDGVSFVPLPKSLPLLTDTETIE